MKNGGHFPGGLWCFANGTTLTRSSFRKHFQVQYHLSEIFYRNFLINGKRSWTPLVFPTYYFTGSPPSELSLLFDHTEADKLRGKFV